jgi:hypothetical protein
MSAFRPAGGGGSGITPAQLDLLVSDPELAVSLAGTEAAIKARVTAEAVATRGAVSALAAGQTTDNAALLALLTPRPGDVELVTRANGTPDAGYTKASGNVLAVTEFSAMNHLLVPNNSATSGVVTSTQVSARKAYSGASLYFLSGLQHYAFNTGTAAWATLAPVPGPASQVPTVFGSAGNLLLAGGGYTTSNPSASLYTYDPATSAWSQRVSLPTARSAFGVADYGGAAYIFGGATGSPGATTALDEVYLFMPQYNSLGLMPARLPVKMYNIHTAFVPGTANNGNQACVVLFPANITDGAVALVNNPRRCWRWTDSGVAVELDPLPDSGLLNPGALYTQTDGTVLYLPSALPSANSGRARRLNPWAAPGSQWSGVNWGLPDDSTAYPMPGGTSSPGPYSAGHVCYGIGSGPFLLFLAKVKTPAAGYAEAFYQIKN